MRCAELLTGRRRRSGLIKQSLSVLVSLDIKMLSTGTLFTPMLLSQRAYCVRERRERNRKGKKRERVKAIMQVAGTNGSYQKMRLEWLARL